MGMMDKIRELMGKKSGGGLLGEPGSTQRPGPISGGPGDGPTGGGGAGPAAPSS